MATRKGKHRSGNVRMGVYVAPIRKAMPKKQCNGATLRRYIVEWQADGKVCGKEFNTLRMAKAFAKDMTKTALRLVESGHDEDGDLAALAESIHIYAATLEPVERT